ncbi:MAG: hypothetical protein ACOYL3_07960 [Desulfuromonadaceae bacterium]
MKKIIRHLEAQGGSNAQPVFTALSLAGLIATTEAAPATVAALLIGITAPPFANLAKYTSDRMLATDETGRTFEAALTGILSTTEPSMLDCSQISINQEQPWARISYFDAEVAEYETDNRPQSIRTETVISGGMIGFLAMKLKFPVTEGGWK